MTTDTAVLATACINQPALAGRPARVLLVGAATLRIFYRFGTLGFDLQAHSTTVIDDPGETISWLAEALNVPPKRLLLWRSEDIVVPSLIAAAETARDVLGGARLLCEVDVAETYGGSTATSFDAVAHGAGVAFLPMTWGDLAEAHRTSHHAAIREHLAARVNAIWQLWLAAQVDAGPPIAATDAWLATPDAEMRL